MAALINIIHPHIYRCVPDDGIDYRVVDFLKKSSKYGAEVCAHFEIRDNLLGACMRKAALEMDMVLGEIFMDEKVKSFFTLGNGFPFPDENPGTMDKESWDELMKYSITHSGLREEISGHFPIIFLGGAFERCVGNIAAYCADKYGFNKGEIFCVDDLSVSINKEDVETMKGELKKRNINIVRYGDILEILEHNNS